MAGTSLVAFDAIEPLWTQASLAELTSKAGLTEARATHVVTLPSIDTPAGLSTADPVGSNRALILTPIKQEMGTVDRLASARWK